MKGAAIISLGKTKTQEKDGEGKRPYILKHKAKDARQDGPLLILDNKIISEEIDFKRECRKAKEKMEELSIPGEEGPYADRDGELAVLAASIREQAVQKEGGDDSIIEKMIEVFGEGELPLEVNEYLLRKSDKLVVAGDILAETERRDFNEADKSEILVIQDFFEGMMLAVAVMRRMGFDAYPSFAHYSRDGENEAEFPIISVLDKGEIPLVTFDISQKVHPHVAEVELIGDEAVLGVTNLYQARNTVRKFTMAMMDAMEKENRRLEYAEVEGYIRTVAELINEFSIRCEIPVFETKFLGLLDPGGTEEIMDAIPDMSPDRIVMNGSPEMIGMFSMIKDAYSQVKLIEIQNNTSPENVEDVMNNTGIQMGILHDGLKMALGLRYKVFMEHIRVAGEYEESLN